MKIHSNPAIRQLDQVLNYLNNDNESFEKFYDVKSKLKFENKNLDLLLDKLSDDGYVLIKESTQPNVDKINPPTYYRITYNGRLFSNQGGYAKEFRNKKLKQMWIVSKIIANIINAFAIIIIGILSLSNNEIDSIKLRIDKIESDDSKIISIERNTKNVIKPDSIKYWIHKLQYFQIKHKTKNAITMFSFFKKKSNESDETKISIEGFCDLINNGEEINFLKLFEIPLGILNKATQEQINSNLEDKKNGVIEVYYNSQINVFNIFTSIVYKVYEDGSKQYFFHTTTDNVKVVQDLSSKLYNYFGDGNFNEEKFSSFKELKNIENIAKGNVYSEKDECVNWWTGKNDHLIRNAVYLQYRVNPLRQFILNINVSGFKGWYCTNNSW